MTLEEFRAAIEKMYLDTCEQRNKLPDNEVPEFKSMIYTAWGVMTKVRDMLSEVQ